MKYIVLLFLFFYSCASLKIAEMTDPSSTSSHDGRKKKKYEGASGVSDGESIGALEENSSSYKDKKSESSKGLSDSDDYTPPKKQESGGGLKAGFSDDNKQFGFYVSFLKKYSYVEHIPIDISERIQIEILGSSNQPIFNTPVTIKDGSKKLMEGRTYSDGTFNFYPSLFSQTKMYTAEIEHNGNKTTIDIEKNGKRKHTVTLQTSNSPSGMDIVFLLDTTGSMGSEINQLKTTIETIHLNLSQSKELRPVRFGMVLYRDRGDDYVTKVVPLTENLRSFQTELNKVSADGGGDTPEDLQAALIDTVEKMNWETNSVKLAFVITDAPPQMYANQKTYKTTALEAKARAIKIHSIGTGGLPLQGEYILRQISQLTQGRYIFLTYGEKGESEGGTQGSVSHHTGSNFQTDKLETIVIRFAREEIENSKGKKEEGSTEYFLANKIDTERKEDTLLKLLDMSVSQLLDYSSYTLSKEDVVSILPFVPTQKKYTDYMSEQVLLSLQKSKKFVIVDRSKLNQILKEQKLSISGAIEEKDAVKLGKLLNAKILISGDMYEKKKNYELFLKLIRTETGEVLSITKAVIDKSLLL
jgi:Mg-chelatase subunit ChlD/TolB-like protein